MHESGTGKFVTKGKYESKVTKRSKSFNFEEANMMPITYTEIKATSVGMKLSQIQMTRTYMICPYEDGKAS